MSGRSCWITLECAISGMTTIMAIVLEDGINAEMISIRHDAKNAFLLYLSAVADALVPSCDVANAPIAHMMPIIADIKPIVRKES